MKRLPVHLFESGLSVSDRLGVPGIDVRAKDETASAYYLRHGFDRSQSTPARHDILLPEVRALFTPAE